MLKLLFALSIITVILLCPFPIKISLKYIDKEISMYVYFKKINLTSILDKSTDKYERVKDKRKNFKPFSMEVFKKIYNKQRYSTHKPKLKLDIKGSYGVDDAAVTAILYGCINSLYGIFYKFTDDIFTIKESKFIFKPIFNKPHFHIEINSIIFINLVNIIYIAIIVIFSLIKVSKRIKPKLSNVEEEI